LTSCSHGTTNAPFRKLIVSSEESLGSIERDTVYRISGLLRRALGLLY
jgi:hypothetical protein